MAPASKGHKSKQKGLSSLSTSCRSKIPKSQRKTEDACRPKPDERPFSLDPEFADFDYSLYESSIMNPPGPTIESLSPRAQDVANTIFSKVTRGLGIPQVSSVMIGSSSNNIVSPESVKVLKAAPGLDANNNEQESYVEVSVDQSQDRVPSSDFMSDMEVWKRLEQSESDRDNYFDPDATLIKAQEKTFSANSTLTTNRHMQEPHLKVSQADSELKRKQSKERVNRVSVFVNQITEIFMQKLLSSESAENIVDKLQKQNDVFKEWIRYMYEQYNVTVTGFEEMEDLVAANLKEYRERSNKHKKRIHALESENTKLRKAVMTRKSSSKFAEVLSEKIAKLNASVVEKDESLKKFASDIKVLTGLIIRLKHGGIWDCNGMKGKLSPEVYSRLFQGQEDLSGKRLEYIQELDDRKAKLREQVRELKEKYDKIKTALQKKESELEKAKADEQRALKVLADAKSKKTQLKLDIEELRRTRTSLQSCSPSSINDFVRM